jgi:RNA polymerase sigma-70 factor (ECF subfamily)
MAAPTDPIRDNLAALLPRLRRFARALAANAADADDLVQTALEKALLRLDQFKPDTRLDAWMFRIMRNAWIDEARARQVRLKRYAPEEAGAMVAGEDARTIEARMELKAVERAMALLPPEQREAVALVLVEGFSYKEAAAALDVPMGTLTSRLARGRAALEAAISGEEKRS